MGKTFKDSEGVGFPRSSNVAKGMITSGTGKKQIFRAKQDRRKKDKRNSWEFDRQENG